MKNKNLIIKALFGAMFIGNMFGGNDCSLQIGNDGVSENPLDENNHEQNAPLNCEQQELPYNRSNNARFSNNLCPYYAVCYTRLYNPSSNRWFDWNTNFEPGDDYENPQKNYEHIYRAQYNYDVIKEWMGEYFDGEPLIKLFEKFPNCYFCPQERNWYKFTINENNKYVNEIMTPEEEKDLNSILMRHFHPDPEYLKLILKQEEYDRKIYEEYSRKYLTKSKNFNA